MAKIILYSNDIIGQKMAGPGIRYVQMARALSRSHDVVLLAPYGSDIKDERFQFKSFRQPKKVSKLIRKADLVIAQKLPPVLLQAIRRTGGQVKFIADFYDPVVLENLEANRVKEIEEQRAIYFFEYANQTLQLAAADHILVASDRQRDFWLGILLQMGRIIPEVYNDDASLSKLISIVPFGIASEKPQLTNPSALRDLISNLKKDDKVLLWGGGIWNWFDPPSVIEAMKKIEKSHPEIKLLFLGTKHPNPDAPEMKMTSRAVELAEEMKLLGKTVFFNHSWVPYEERQNYLLPCWAAISTHFDHAETRLSFRTRIVDSYIWAGLPIIATVGDSMADLIEREKLGITVNYTDSQAIANAVAKLAEEPDFYQECRNNVLKIKNKFYWEKLIDPINHLIEQDNWTPAVVDSLSFTKLIFAYYITGVKKILTTKGWSGLFSKIWRKR